jgi:hypothetical protein
VSTYSSGASRDGWICIDCGARFEHERTSRRWTFAGFIIHKLVRHHRLPRRGLPPTLVTEYNPTTWTATYRRLP